jgi:oligopeptide transport system ATP-binding protein
MSGNGAANGALLEVTSLHKYYPITSGIIFKHKIGDVQAVDDISFEVASGETLALVGESGCGKSTTARAVLRLVEPTSGSVKFEGEEITKADRNRMRRLRREMQIIFQDPYASLNPRMTVRNILTEPFKIHGLDAGDRVQDLLEKVGLAPEHADRYPHEFSGGQRQRIGIARALVLQPKLIVCDEPVSALDVSIQSQVLNLLKGLQQNLGLSYVFIAHNLAVVKHIADRIGVMYLGKLVEVGHSEALYREPLHPYTQALVSAIPQPRPDRQRRRQRIVLSGDVPSAIAPPAGCRFHTRCPHVMDRCRVEEPLPRDVGGQAVACHLY